MNYTHPQHSIHGIVRSALLYFGLVFGAGFLLAMIRVPFLVPRLGERMAELIEMPFMFAAIYWAAGYVVRKYSASVTGRGWWYSGALALLLLLEAEFLLAVVLAERSVGEYIASRDPVSGSVYLFGLLLFALMPWWRSSRSAG